MTLRTIHYILQLLRKKMAPEKGSKIDDMLGENDVDRD